jgi:hypothetical protein
MGSKHFFSFHIAPYAIIAPSINTVKLVSHVAVAFFVASGEISQITWQLLSLSSRVSNAISCFR